MGETDSEELSNHLGEQLMFLRASAEAYDGGTLIEAKRLALQVRVLVHDTGASRSLLHALGRKETIPWVEAIPQETIAVIEQTLTDPTVTGAYMPTLATYQLGPDRAEYVPTCSISSRFVNDLSSEVSFDVWWKAPRMLAPTGEPISRRQVVLWLANKDGGGHVDELPPQYRAISRESALGTLSGAPTQSPFPAAMRHIAEELLVSLKRAGMA